jgi:hypothetical protein
MLTSLYRKAFLHTEYFFMCYQFTGLGIFKDVWSTLSESFPKDCLDPKGSLSLHVSGRHLGTQWRVHVSSERLEELGSKGVISPKVGPLWGGWTDLLEGTLLIVAGWARVGLPLKVMSLESDFPLPLSLCCNFFLNITVPYWIELPEPMIQALAVYGLYYLIKVYKMWGEGKGR